MDEKGFVGHEGPSSPGDGQLVSSEYIKPQFRKFHDPDVTFEEYRYYAQRTREEEKGLESPKLRWREILQRKTKSDIDEVDPSRRLSQAPDVNFASESGRAQISDEVGRKHQSCLSFR